MTTYLLIIIGLLILGLIWLCNVSLKYKNLCIKLTKVINDMYCEVPDCNHYKYNTNPIDGTKGYMDKMCAIHMAQRMESEAVQND